MKQLKINNSSEIKQILDKAKDISIAEEMGIMTYIYDLEQKVKGIDKVIEDIEKNKELLHHSFDEPDCDYWIAINPDELLEKLRGEDNASN